MGDQPALTPFELVAVFLALSAAVNWFNARFIQWPNPVAAVVIGAGGALALLVLHGVAPNAIGSLESPLERFNFSSTVLDVFLAYLMFAGGMQVDVAALRRSIGATAVLATLGVAVSAAVIGFGFFGIAGLVGLEISLGWALVFGTLMSPTDPVAVLAMLKSSPLQREVTALMQGEALFNDGVSIVLFAAALAFAQAPAEIDLTRLITGFVREAGGGIALGVAGGALVVVLLGSVDDYPVETGITLALATGVYAAASRLDVSGPIAAAAAGLIIGGPHAATAMSKRTQGYVRGFWYLIDEMLNSLLFLLVGLEVLVLRPEWAAALAAAFALPLALSARFASVVVATLLLTGVRSGLGFGLAPVLTWGGVRGGVSIALALSIPSVPEKPAILLATYVVAIFSIVVQGPTLRPLADRFGLERKIAPDDAGRRNFDFDRRDG